MTIILGRNIILLYGNTVIFMHKPGIIMKVSILQYEANSVYEFVTKKTGNRQDPWIYHSLVLINHKKLTTI